MMQKPTKFMVARLILLAFSACTIWQSPVFARGSAHSSLAWVSRYSMPENAEITMARSAAPPAISADATVMVLGRKGYTTVAWGKNGFLCLVERSWGSATTDPEFWNPRVRGPICFNPAAARTFAPIYLMKTRLVLAGKSKVEINSALASAFNRKDLPSLEPGAMCYMLSQEQYLGDQGKRWHPHLMFFISGDATKSWGGNLAGSPIIATNDPEERATIFIVRVGHWSDGTSALQTGR